MTGEIQPGEVEGRWTKLRNRAVFRLTGSDRIRFLNGQVTNEVSRASPETAVPACVCNIKGKVEFLVWISGTGDSLILDGQLDQRETLHARLERYLIADDCEIEDITGSLTLIHHFIESGGGAASRRLTVPGRDFWVAEGDGLDFEPGEEIPPEEFELLQLRSALPKSPFEITGNEFPAELKLTWAVDFHKGCYLGQEVVSRIQSVGRVKRTLILAYGGKPFPRNASLRIEGDRPATSTRDALAVPNFFFLAPAWLRTDSKKSEDSLFQRVTE